MKPRHITFCLFYLRNFNGAEAARKAGYSEKRANKVAYSLLRKPETKRYLKNKLSEIWQDEADVVRARVYNLWSEMAFPEALPLDAPLEAQMGQKAMQLKASELLAKYLPAGQLGEPEPSEESSYKIIKMVARRPDEGNRVLAPPEADTVP